MFYLKQNVGGVERVMRIAAGGMMIAGGVLAFRGLPLGFGVIAAGAMAMMTGLVGYCPMCALVGRKPLDSH